MTQVSSPLLLVPSCGDGTILPFLRFEECVIVLRGPALLEYSASCPGCSGARCQTELVLVGFFCCVYRDLWVAYVLFCSCVQRAVRDETYLYFYDSIFFWYIT
jgi:hypothetical protein